MGATAIGPAAEPAAGAVRPGPTALVRARLVRPAWAGVIWGGLGALGALALLRLEPNMLEEGLVLHVAQRLAHGEHLYRDIVFFTGPLPFELLGLLFRIFGESVFVGRLALLPLIVAAVAAAFALARRAGVGPLAHAIAAVWAAAPVLGFPLLSLYFYATLSLYAAPIAGYATLRGRESARWALAAGVTIACIAICKQVLGVALALTLLPALVALAPAGARLRPLGAAIGGGLAVTAVVVGFYAARGDLGALVYSVAQLPFELEGSFTVPYLNLWPPGAFDAFTRASAPLYMPVLLFLRWGLLTDTSTGGILLTQALYALPFVALIATGVRRLFGPLPAAAWISFAVTLAMLSNVYPRGDWGHVVYVLPPAIAHLLLLAALARERVGVDGHPRWAGAVTVVLCIALYTGVTVTATWLNTVARSFNYGPNLPLHPVTPTYRTETIPRVIDYLLRRVYPGEPIFVARQEPVLYFATGTTNPTAFPGMVLAMRERQDRELLSALAELRYVVMSDIDQPLYHYYADEMPAVQDYLERHFYVPRDFPIDDMSWVIVVERGPDRGPALVDFWKKRQEGRFFVRDAAGRVSYIDDPVPKFPSRMLRRPFGIPLGPRGGGVDFDLVLPAGPVAFDASLGLKGLFSRDALHDQAWAGRHALSISVEGGPFVTVRTARMADRQRDYWLRWRPITVDLTQYAGRRVTLRLEMLAEAPFKPGQLAWWGSPRLIESSASRQP